MIGLILVAAGLSSLWPLILGSCRGPGAARPANGRGAAQGRPAGAGATPASSGRSSALVTPGLRAPATVRETVVVGAVVDLDLDDLVVVGRLGLGLALALAVALGLRRRLPRSLAIGQPIDRPID